MLIFLPGFRRMITFMQTNSASSKFSSLNFAVSCITRCIMSPIPVTSAVEKSNTCPLQRSTPLSKCKDCFVRLISISSIQALLERTRLSLSLMSWSNGKHLNHSRFLLICSSACWVTWARVFCPVSSSWHPWQTVDRWSAEGSYLKSSLINGGKVFVGIFTIGTASTWSELKLLEDELFLGCLAAGSDLTRALKLKDVFLCFPPGVRSSRTAEKNKSERKRNQSV